MRENFCLSVPWLSEQAGVQVRTMRDWESGRTLVPEDVSQILARIDLQLNEAAEKLVDTAKNGQENHQVWLFMDQVWLLRYRTDDELWSGNPTFKPLPITAYGVVLARAVKRLTALGLKTRIIYDNEKAYFKWLHRALDSKEARRQFNSGNALV